MSDLITICGGGNAAHTLAGILGSRDDCAVRVYAPFGDEAARWQAGIRQNGGITVVTPQTTFSGRPEVISSDPGEAVAGSRLVLLALPAFAHETILNQIRPHLSPGAWVGALPARGGFDLCVQDVFKGKPAGHVIFGFQTLPWACRIQEFGQRALILGVKQQVDVAVWPADQAPGICGRLQELLSVPLNPISNFLSLDLADTGQLIHPGIMYGLFHHWNGEPLAEPSLFYQAVDQATAGLLEKMSAEIQSLRASLENKFPALDLSAVRTLDEWLLISYAPQITDSGTLRSKFTSNRSYAGLLAPMRKVQEGWIPDFQARYLAEDVPYNLLVARGVAALAGVSTPVIDQVLLWAQARLEKEYLVDGRLEGADLKSTRAPQRYGYTHLEQLLQAMDDLTSSREKPQARNLTGW